MPISVILEILWFHTQGIFNLIVNILEIQFACLHFSLSPDLNPCEHVGAAIKELVRNERPIINSEDELWAAVTTAQEVLCTTERRQFFINMLNSMPTRIAQVVEAGGGHTSYWILFITKDL
jgi:hypothetical protein